MVPHIPFSFSTVTLQNSVFFTSNNTLIEGKI